MQYWHGVCFVAIDYCIPRAVFVDIIHVTLVNDLYCDANYAAFLSCVLCVRLDSLQQGKL